MIRGRLLTGLLLLGALGSLLPFVWMVAFSFGRPAEFLRLPPPMIPSAIRLDNYQLVFDRVPMLDFLRNSLVVTVAVVIGQVIICSMAAYAFSRLRFPGRNVLFVLLLATLMVPIQVTIVPLYLMMRPLGLVNSIAALILPAIPSAFGVFLLRQFFATIPRELEEAATLDGAGHLTVYARVIMPLSWPAIASLSILAFNATWNSFLWPLIAINSPENMTVPVGITFLNYAQRGAGSTGVVMAGVTLSVIPPLIVFLLLQRRLVEGVAGTSPE